MSAVGGLRVGVSGVKQGNVILLIEHKPLKNCSLLGIYVICKSFDPIILYQLSMLSIN